MTAASVISTVGVTLLLGAYWGNQTGRLVNGVVFDAMNGLGAGLAAIGSALIPFLPFVVLEASWSLVAVRSLVRRYSSRSS